ncbi:hypothetical protein HRbin17_01501 [bacterium HR17]|uniref:Uncharacterized protein n=1 Tax=Candidatus Fervidibacter japonicus TaxID=2035412 RepID=A0A2H5XCS3_9BACT|nr:hypothetical protein HRbin17_01501 [bacterium HR17]
MVYHFRYAQREHLRTNLKSLYFMFWALVLLPPFVGGISILVRWGLLADGSKLSGKLNEWQKLLGLTGIMVFCAIYIVLIVFISLIAKSLHFIDAEYKLDDMGMTIMTNSILIEIKWLEIEEIKRPTKLSRFLPFWDGVVVFITPQTALPVGIAYLHKKKEEFLHLLQTHLPSFCVNELSKIVNLSPAGLWIMEDKRLKLSVRRKLLP